jgi:hypothetical protein
MSSIINASSSGAGGVITTADSSGILQLQTAGVTALTIDASQHITLTKPVIIQGASSGTITLQAPAIAGSSVLTLPATTDTVVCKNTTDTLTNKTFVGITETVYPISDGAAFEINPTNGTIQTITLGASRTPKGTSFAAGQSVTLMVTAGAYTITWTDATLGSSGVKWLGGIAPVLSTTTITTVILWKVGTQVYGKGIGDT